MASTLHRVLARIRADSRATFIPDGSSRADVRVNLFGLTGHEQAIDFNLIDLAAHHGVRPSLRKVRSIPHA